MECDIIIDGNQDALILVNIHVIYCNLNIAKINVNVFYKKRSPYY